jgi:hypothetical protein
MLRWVASLHAYMEQCLINKQSIKAACDTYEGEDKWRQGEHEEKRPL